MIIRRIWVYDDDAIIEQDLILTLAAKGYEVESKSKLDIAELICAEPSINTADIIISNNSPFENLKSLNDQKFPLILLSSYRPKDLEMKKDLTFTPLFKPYVPHQLFRIIENISVQDSPFSFN